jgi:hypothetical protein
MIKNLIWLVKIKWNIYDKVFKLFENENKNGYVLSNIEITTVYPQY